MGLRFVKGVDIKWLNIWYYRLSIWKCSIKVMRERTAILVSLPERKSKNHVLSVVITVFLHKINVVSTNLEDLIWAQQTYKCKCVYGLKCTTCQRSSPDMYRFRLGIVAAGARIIPGLRLRRCIGVTWNGLEFIQIPVFGEMVVVVQLPENSLDWNDLLSEFSSENQKERIHILAWLRGY